MRKSIRIFRLIRRRRFKYRRLHAWRLDVVAVMVLFGAGWLLIPPLNEAERSVPVSVGRAKLSIVGKAQFDTAEAVLSPAMFAFTTPEGFANGVVAAQLDEMGSQIPFAPSTPNRFYSRLPPEPLQDSSWSGFALFDSFKLPPPPVQPSNTSYRVLPAREVYVETSIPGIVSKGHFSSIVENAVGKSVRIAVHFGADGRGDGAVLFSHSLDASDAARVERAAMRLTGPPNEVAWILLMFSGD